jgi:hypothetical protein
MIWIGLALVALWGYALLYILAQIADHLATLARRAEVQDLDPSP